MDDQQQTPLNVPSEDQIQFQERPSASNQQAASGQQYDEEIKSDKIETKRKTFFMDLKANNMGRYVKISERSSGKRSTIIVPEENIQEFINKIHGLFS